MFKIFSKKEKKVKLKDLREPEISPKRDWRLVLYVFFAWVLFCLISIGFVFIVIMKGDISVPADPLKQEDVTINRNKLKNAVEFIQSRQ